MSSRKYSLPIRPVTLKQRQGEPNGLYRKPFRLLCEKDISSLSIYKMFYTNVVIKLSENIYQLIQLNNEHKDEYINYEQYCSLFFEELL